jgi:peroxiredoxin
MMWKGLLSVGAAVVIGAVIVTSSVAEDAASAAKAQIGADAPAFSLKDQDGNTVSLSDFADKIVVLEWFNDECPIVVRHYKNDAMNKLAAKYKEKGVVWLAVNSTNFHDVAHNKEAATKMKINRPILDDRSGAVGKAYGATNTPGMYVINKDRKLAYMGAIDDNASDSNATPKNYVAQALDELLAAKAVSEPKTQQYGCSVKYAD